MVILQNLKPTPRLYLILVLVLSQVTLALDLLELEEHSDLHCEILLELKDSVIVVVDDVDTVLAKEGIERMNYSNMMFNTEYKIISTQGKYTIKREGDTFLSGASINMLPQDTITTDSSGQVDLIFKNGYQIKIDTNTTFLVQKFSDSKKGRWKQTIDFFLIKGTIWFTGKKLASNLIHIKIFTPVAMVHVTGTVFFVNHDEEKKETSTGAYQGSVGVQLLRSEMGEVVVNAGERVSVSSEKQKIMQDELHPGEGVLLDEFMFQSGFRRVRDDRKITSKLGMWSFIGLVGGGVVAVGSGMFVYVLLTDEEVPEEPTQTDLTVTW